MDYRIIEKDNRKYIRLNHGGSLIKSERDALDILSVCMEHGTNLLFIPGERLSDEFLHLSTGIAGAILQKFVLYGIKAAVVLDADSAKGKFRDFLVESNRGNTFRAYIDFDEAESWLLSD